jgi:hypothetical protein
MLIILKLRTSSLQIKGKLKTIAQLKKSAIGNQKPMAQANTRGIKLLSR